MAEGKQHLSIVICGHVDSGKSTTSEWLAGWWCRGAGILWGGAPSLLQLPAQISPSRGVA
jgi:hypothetical protein